MIGGIITARHILLHPFTIISIFGVAGYVRLIGKCMDGKPHCFADFLLK